MPDRPIIIVQIVHIEGPFKGKIEEYPDAIVRIGRNPDCQICFPKETTIISRNHAEIVREGNRFKLVDHSTNGTFVNGKSHTEIFLKNGDVIMIGEGGPKISFLTETKTADAGFSSAFLPGLSDKTTPPSSPEASYHARQLESQQQERAGKLSEAGGVSPPEAEKPLAAAVDAMQLPALMGVKVRAPLVIQLGPTIRSFQQLPVIVGGGDDCDYVIQRPGIIDRHIHFTFYESNYWVVDLAGQGTITINDCPVQSQAPIHPGSRISLGSHGPVFQFLDGGRLVEVTDPTVAPDSRDLAQTPSAIKPEMRLPSHRKSGRLALWVIIFIPLILLLTWLFFNPGMINGGIVKEIKEWWIRLMASSTYQLLR